MNKYNSNNFKETICFIQQVFELCNGRINLTKKPKELRIIFHSNQTAYISNKGIFYFNITAIQYMNDTSKTMILDIIAHELSHLDQNVDYNRYKNDKEYYKYIESTNIERTYNFIMRNKDSFEKLLGFNIDMNYMNTIKNLYK